MDLIDYATRSFPNQIDFETDTGMNGFGTSTIKYLSASYFGIKLAPTFVTSDVYNARLELSNIMLMNQYYEQNLNTLLFSYRVDWLKFSLPYNILLEQYKYTKNNIEVLFNANNPEEGALGCYSKPDDCIVIYNNIKSLLK